MPLTYPASFFKAAASGPADVTNTSSGTSTANASSYTFSARNIGTAASDRHVIVGVASTTAATISSVTVAGTSCTQAVTASTSGMRSTLYITNSPITSGTSGDVVVTLSGTDTSCGVAVFRATGLQSTTATATATQLSDNTATNLAVTANGIAVGLAHSTNNDTFTHVWTGLTEQNDLTIEGVEAFTYACDNQASTTTISITVDAESSGFPGVAQVFAAWR